VKHFQVIEGEGTGTWITDPDDDIRNAYDWALMGEKSIWFSKKEHYDFSFLEDGTISTGGNWMQLKDGGFAVAYPCEDE
jgi:hypothetical protein